MDIIDIFDKFGVGYLLTLFWIIVPYVEFSVLYEMFQSYARGDPFRRCLLPGLRDRSIVKLPNTMDLLDLDEIFGYSSDSSKRCTFIVDNDCHILNFSNVTVSLFKFIRISLCEFTLNFNLITTINLSYTDILDDDISVLNSLINLRDLTAEHCEFLEKK